MIPCPTKFRSARVRQNYFCYHHDVASVALTFTQCNVHMPCELTSPRHRIRTQHTPIHTSKTRTTNQDDFSHFSASSTFRQRVYPTVHVQLDASTEHVRFFIARLIIMRAQLTPQSRTIRDRDNLQFIVEPARAAYRWPVRPQRARPFPQEVDVFVHVHAIRAAHANDHPCGALSRRCLCRRPRVLGKGGILIGFPTRALIIRRRLRSIGPRQALLGAGAEEEGDLQMLLGRDRRN